MKNYLVANGTCECGNEGILFNGKCRECTFNKLAENETVSYDNLTDTHGEIGKDYITFALFTRRNNSNNMSKLARFIKENGSEISITKGWLGSTGIYETNGNKYNRFTITIPTDIDKLEYQFVTSLVMFGKGISYDMKYDSNNDSKKFMARLVLKNDENALALGRMMILAERYPTLFRRLTNARIDVYSNVINTVEKLDRIKGYDMDKLSEYLITCNNPNFRQVDDKMLQVVLGRPTLHTNLLVMSNYIKAFVKFATNMTQEQLNTMTSEAKFIQLLLESITDVEIVSELKTLLANRGCLQNVPSDSENPLSRYFGDDYHEGDDDYYDED